MEHFAAQLNILNEILVKKKRFLTQVLTISENQETILLSKLEPEEISAYFVAMNGEKQGLIEEVIGTDDVFQSVFDGIRDIFDENAPLFKADIGALQAEIKELIEMDTQIRLQEEKNKSHLARINKTTVKIDLSQAAKDYVIKQYSKNME